MSKDIRLEIGFSGGASTGAAIPEQQLEELTKALSEEGRDQWFVITSSDGSEVHVDLSSVNFIRIGTRNRSIGFAEA